MCDTMAELNQKNPWVSRLLLIIALESDKIGPRVLRSMPSRRTCTESPSFGDLATADIRLIKTPSLKPDWAATQIFSSYLVSRCYWYLHGPRFDLRRSLRRQAREFMRNWSVAK